MLFDPAFLLQNIGLVLLTVLLVLLGKSMIFAGITRAFGYGNAAPLIVGLGLFQVGEFSFVLARVGLDAQVISDDLYALVLTTAIVTMVLTPFLARTATPLYGLWRRYVPRESLSTFNLPSAELRDHVIVAGYGRVGQAATSVMRRVGLEFVVIEIDQRLIERCHTDGFPVIYGDATSEIVLEAARVEHARLLLVTLPEANGAQLIASRVAQLHPRLHVIARATDREQLHELKRLGVHEIVQPELEAGLEMVRQVLIHFDVEPADIQHFSESVHQELYAPFYEEGNGKEPGTRSTRLLQQMRRISRTLDIEWCTLLPESSIAGQTISSAQIRTRTGASIVALVRDQEMHPNPEPNYRLEAGDALAMLGTLEQRHALRHLLEPTPAGVEHI
jgi:CPA2 family monovalent cation:H+ antiporter-2